AHLDPFILQPEGEVSSLAFPQRAKKRRKNRVPSLPTRAEEFLYGAQFHSLPIVRQTFHKDAAVLLLQNSIVEQGQQAAVMQRTNQPPEALFERDHRRGHLVLKERIPPFRI